MYPTFGDPDVRAMPNQNQTVVISEDEEIGMNRHTLRIPPFWPEEPELWFAQLEGQFALTGIKDDEARYAHTLSRIAPKQAKEIKDIITPPAKGKYKAIKTALIQRLTDSQGQRIRQLLEREELGDRKPSQFLRHLSTLAGSAVPSELLRTLWLGRLPQQMQAILATRANDDLADIAEQADSIHEVNCDRAVVLATAVPPAQAASQMPWEAQIEALTKQVAALTSHMTKMSKQLTTERGRRRDKSRSRDRARSKTPKHSGVCFYHKRFGEDARKCTHPCTFAKSKNEEGSH